MPTNRHESSLMSLFFELLQVALGTREKLSRVPTAAEWNDLYNESERQAVVGVMLGGLERLPQEQLPPLELKLQWIGMVQMMEAEYKVHCERAKELTSRFRSVGFKSCVLKGVGMAQYYPVPERRQCGDIDLWVDGRRKDVMAWLRSQYKIGLVTWHHVDAEFFEDVPVEVHVHPTWLYGPLRNRHLQAFFDRIREAQIVVDKKLGFAYPSVKFNAVYSLIHTFHHVVEEGIGLRHIVDYYYVLRQVQEFKGSRVQEDTLRFISRIGLGKFLGAMMWLMKDVCEAADEMLLCEPDEREGRFLLNEVMEGGNFGKYRTDNLKHNSAARVFTLLPHYPNEVLWVVPWKCWHKCWRMVNQR